MHDILKERLWRKLQTLPQEQVYQVLDYIEFLESRYARQQAIQADPIQKFAERLEDGMRMRSVAPKVIHGTVGLLGTARKVLRSVSDAGREILEASTPAPRPAASGTLPATRSVERPLPLDRAAAATDEAADAPAPRTPDEDGS
jgi:hypothetical protein